VLWYKAWLETRSRFLIALCGMVALPSYYIYNETQGVAFAKADWYYRALHVGNGLIAAMWVAAVMLLMMGGLLRERAVGTASFTLALPVSRLHLMRVRILLGILHAVALTVVPWAAMFVVSNTFGVRTAFYQAAFHVTLLASGGTIFFALALLASSLIEGEYTAPAACFGAMFADVIAFGDKTFKAYSPWTFMVATEYFDRKTELLVGSIPWSHVLANVLVAALLIVFSVLAIQRKEF
jgi:ABC-2 type transport system permease protein